VMLLKVRKERLPVRALVGLTRGALNMGCPARILYISVR
jgi:hypothetical protein